MYTIIYLGCLLAYQIITEGVNIIMAKLDVLLNITWKLDPKLVLDIFRPSLGIKYIEHHNEMFGIIG